MDDSGAFNRSNMMHRTPPGSGTIPTVYTTFSCKTCDKIDTDYMVQCDNCDEWHHYECVGVTGDIEDSEENWYCKKCQDAEGSELEGEITSKPMDAEQTAVGVEQDQFSEAETERQNRDAERLELEQTELKRRYELEQAEKKRRTQEAETAERTRLAELERAELEDQARKEQYRVDQAELNRLRELEKAEMKLQGLEAESAERTRLAELERVELEDQARKEQDRIDQAELKRLRDFEKAEMKRQALEAESAERRRLAELEQVELENQARIQQERLNQAKLNLLREQTERDRRALEAEAAEMKRLAELERVQLQKLQRNEQERLENAQKERQTAFEQAEKDRITEKIKYAASNSKSSRKSRSSTVSKNDLALQLLEEEKALELKYLRKKYELLELEASERSSSTYSSNSSRSRVHEWLNKSENGRKQEKRESTNPATWDLLRVGVGVTNTHRPPSESLNNGNPGNQDEPTDQHSEHHREQHISKRQIAARHAVPKELPNFNGEPEAWPMFISAFENTSRMCGFTSEENMTRLQKCLKGKALEAVQSSILHPSSLPKVMSTLKMLFGRPELIIDSLLQKIRSTPAPKAEKLETLVDYAIAVNDLCSVMEVSGLKDYLCNPSLLRELVKKLPSNVKLSWGLFKQSAATTNLADFSSWLYTLAMAASSVADTCTTDNKVGKKDPRGNGFLNAHVEEQNNEQKEKKTCGICNGTCSSVVGCKEFQELSHSAKWAAVKELKLCRSCLKPHGFSRCSERTVCGKNNCTYLHHKLLHNDAKDTPSVNTENHNHHDSQSQKSASVLFRIVPVTLYGPNSEIKTHAFLDDGSSLTLVDEDIATELKLKGEPHPLCLKWTADECRYEKDSKKVKFQISGTRSYHKKYNLADVHTVKSLKLPRQSICLNEIEKDNPHLKGIPIESYADIRPRMLIGLDNAYLALSQKSVEGKQNQPMATKTRLGWVAHGVCNNSQTIKPTDFFVHHSLHICNCSENHDNNLQQIVKDFFSLESLGVMAPTKILVSNDEKRAIDMLQSITHRKDDRFETGLLWKYDDVQLPNSLPQAMNRLQCLEKKMTRDPQLAEILKQQIQDYLYKGYIRKLTESEVAKCTPRCWYLPIFPVFNPNKPGKVRIVWDAKAKVNGVSLNSVLLKGPAQLTSLPTVLYKFRERNVAVCGDIREMFHQVQVNENDQHSQRFLWRDGDSTRKPDVYVMQVMTFGSTCSPSCAQYVKNTNAQEYVAKYPRAVKSIIENHYVDDFLDSVNSEDEAIQLATEVKLIHSKAGFEIRNWLSNSISVLRALVGSPSEEKNLCMSEEGEVEKVLGMWWSTATDTFTFKLTTNKHKLELLNGSRWPTKREVLSIVMSIYDPLGLLAHFLIYIKIVMQEVWRSGVGWDDEIAAAQHEKWLIWLNVLPEVERIKIPRCYLQHTSFDEQTQIELHTFVDASENGYAAVCYWRVGEGTTVECSLVGAKTRVAPLRFVSIPRLELEAAVLGTRLANNIKQNHSINISRRYFWSDSQDVLDWLNSDHRRYSTFVAFRVSEVLETTDAVEWNKIPTKVNVADDGTKWQRYPDLSATSRWYKGPQFLWEDKTFWPKRETTRNATTREEIKPNLIHLEEVNPRHAIIPEDFSTWKRLLRTTALVLRYISNLKAKLNGAHARSGLVLQDELINAENFLYGQAQNDIYSKEITLINKHNDEQFKLTESQSSRRIALPKTSPIYRLLPYLDEKGILRVQGRIDAAPYVQENTKRPILLPRGHRITSLIIAAVHEKYHHQNHETVTNELRQKFFIPQLRGALKEVRKSCQFCKVHSVLPQPPAMGNLPAARLATFSRPFSYIGIDYFGPMTVTVGRRNEKRWGVLITCLTIRAVHVEIAHTLSSDSCIMALQNFMSRRGTPIEIFSDNGTNFKAASKELHETFLEISESMSKKFTTTETKWTFIPPASPHMGGSWERMVQSIKRVLYQIMPARNPNDETLRNMLCEIENIVNSRPLTYIPMESEDSEALTPNHFLLGSSNGCKPAAKMSDSGSVQRKNWLTSQVFADLFWKRWVVEFLPTLTRRTKWFQDVKPIETGDIVIIVDPNAPRNCWLKGRVIQTEPSADGQVRRATVQTANGIYERPAVKLAVIDVQATDSMLSPSHTKGECQQ